MSGYKRYREAEKRVEESIRLRREGFPGHDYPRREGDLLTLREYHRVHGIPHRGLLARLRAWLGGRG